MKSIVVFLCTPRCGTQWFVKNLNDIYSEQATTLHEPITYEYYPRINLGTYDGSLEPLNNTILKDHLNFIEKTVKHQIYIEIGWQGIAGVSELYNRFGNRLKFIHLYRNPINVAASLVTHHWYTGKVVERFEKAELRPFDEGAILTNYKKRWHDLSLFEKSLYYWTEINLRALEIHNRYHNIPFYSLKFEDIFKSSKETSRMYLIELMAFMGLDYREELLAAIDIPHDNYKNTTHFSIDWKDIKGHPQSVALANRLGYIFENKFNLNRYKESYSQYFRRKFKKYLPKAMVKFYRELKYDSNNNE